MIVNRLTVGGRDYILRLPVDGLRADILAAIRSGGGYVRLPAPRGEPGVEIFVSRGTPITWTTLELDDRPADARRDRDDGGYDRFLDPLSL
jgi:hypothetical protein